MAQVKNIDITQEVKDKLRRERNPLTLRFSPGLLQFISDTIAFVLSFFAQYFLRFEAGIVETTIKPDIFLVMMTAALYSFYWLAIYFFSGLYKNWYIKSPFDELFTILKVSFFGHAIFIFLVLYDSNATRMMFLYHFFIFIFTVSTGRMIIRRIQRKLRALGVITFDSVLMGSREAVAGLYEKIIKSPSWGFKPVGAIIIEDKKHFAETGSYINEKLPVFGTENSLQEVIKEIKPQELLITSRLEDQNLLLSVANICTENNVRLKIEPDLYHIFTGQTKTHNIYGIPLIEISPQLLKPWQEAIKRIFDIVFSFIVLAAGMPFWLLMALIIKLESRGPVFYKQPRTGKDEKVFQIYKFRSMVQDADRGKQKWTKVGDPRVTRFGKFIRKTHLDEIPQFWNVLKGEMSIVGPRPEQPHFVEDFVKEIPYYKRRLKVRPGITGWWQVKYQAHELNVEEIENRLKDDFYYIENMSLKLDIEIVIRTVWCVVKGHGQT